MVADWPGIATWLLGFVLILYLALQGGGYDAIVREEIGIAVWWIVLCAVGSGALPLPAQEPRRGVGRLALFAGFVVWTALSLGWTESVERTATELARVVDLPRLPRRWRWRSRPTVAEPASLLNGVTGAVGVIALLAVLSRLHPQWFPENTLEHVPARNRDRAPARLPAQLLRARSASCRRSRSRCSLGATAWARTLPGQSARRRRAAAGRASCSSSPARASAPRAAIVGLAAFVVLSPDRLPKLAHARRSPQPAPAILAAGLADRPALDRGLPTPELIAEGNELLVVAIVVCAGVALLQTGDRARGPLRRAPLVADDHPPRGAARHARSRS